MHYLGDTILLGTAWYAVSCKNIMLNTCELYNGTEFERVLILTADYLFIYFKCLM